MGSLSSGQGPTEPLNVRVDVNDTAAGRQIAEALRTGSHRFGRFMYDAVHVGVLAQAAVDALGGGPEQLGPWKSRRAHAVALTPLVTQLIEYQMQNGVTPAIIRTLQLLAKQTAGALPVGSELMLESENEPEEGETGTGGSRAIVAPQETVKNLKKMGAAVHRKGSGRTLPTDLPTTSHEPGGK